MEQKNLNILKAQENVRLYYDNKLNIKNGLEKIDISNGIDWDYQHRSNRNTYQTYLHTLSIINDLVDVGFEKKNEEYFKDAKKIILDWYKSKSENNYKWAEHSVSTRIKNIIIFQESNHRHKIRKRLYNKMILEHCEYLNDEKNYKYNNHGIMMDSALIFACSALTDKKLKEIYLDKALYRIRFAFYRDFSRKGVHLENSPEYQNVILALYKNIVKALKRHGLKTDKALNTMVKNAIDYKRYIIKPDLVYPQLGDTGYIKEKGIKKSYKDFIDYESGMSILQYEDIQNNINSAYLTFKAGYQSKTHKHLDDLSVTYYNFGKDILIDSGKYSYDKENEIRKYMISPEAHNTIVIKNKTYFLNNPLLEQHKMKLTKYTSNKSYKLVSGINNLYPGVSLMRHTILTNDDILLFVDRILCTEEETIQQNFVINKDAKVTKNEQLNYMINIDNQYYTLETYPIRNKEIDTELKQGYYSDLFSEFHTNPRVTFEVNAKKMTFVTALYNKNLASVRNVKLYNNKLYYDVDANNVTIDLQ